MPGNDKGRGKYEGLFVEKRMKKNMKRKEEKF